MLRQPKISVILPTHNGAQFLAETLNSFASQKLSISQLVISDDNSKDDTIKIINNFESNAGFEVTLLEHKPNGVTANYINALKSTTGKFIFVADQDDIWLENKTQVMYEALQDKQVSLVSHDSLIVDEQLNPLGRLIRGDKQQSRALCQKVNSRSDRQNLEVYLQGNIPLLAHTLGFKSDIVPLLINKPNDIDNWWFEEWLGCIALTQGRLKLIEEHLVLYRQHNNQTSGGLLVNNTTPYKVSSGFAKYKSRIEKIGFCLSLIKHNESHKQRYEIISDYHNFLKLRQKIISNVSFFMAIYLITTLIINGKYKRFAKGIRSAALDLITHIKQ